MKPLIIQELGNQLVGKPPHEARQLIDEYFDNIIWSLEKDEWLRMSEDQKSAFVDIARNLIKTKAGSI